MAVSENTGGTQTATVGTEHTLATVNTAGTYQLIVDLDNLANGDVVELRIKVKARSTSTAKVLFVATYSNAQGPDGALAISPPVPAPHQFIATLKQTAGTGRNFEWSIYQY
jgi:hypothetical protein